MQLVISIGYFIYTSNIDSIFDTFGSYGTKRVKSAGYDGDEPI